MHRFCFLLLLFLALPAVPAQAQDPAPPRPELRAFWVDGFNDGFKTPDQCDTLLARLRAAHCNAVFVQMRKRGDAYYASHYEPWAADDPDHFDALAYLCRAAHRPDLPRIAVHAWINACAVGGNKDPRAVARAHPEWFSRSDTGLDYDGESTKIDPGDPAAAEWTFRVYLDVARHYNVDGIHFDFIRYGGGSMERPEPLFVRYSRRGRPGLTFLRYASAADGAADFRRYGRRTAPARLLVRYSARDASPGHWGYNQVSVARFNARFGATGQPAWDDPRWQQWRRDQVTALVRRVALSARAIKPGLVVSAATICWGDGPRDDRDYETQAAAFVEVFAPWRDWLREGLLDLNCPMTYFDLSRRAAFWDHWSAFIKDHQYDRLSAMGCGIYLNSIDDGLEEIRSARRTTLGGHRAAGVVLYSYASNDRRDGWTETSDPAFFARLPEPGLFDRDVPLPPMPWKSHPTSGSVMGMLLRPDTLEPLDGAVVVLRGGPAASVRQAVSDGSGFFAFAAVPPGAYRLSLSGEPGLLRWAPVRVTAGHTTEVLPRVSGGRVADLTAHAKRPAGKRATLWNVLVTSGSQGPDSRFLVADGPGQPQLRVLAPGLVLPAVAGDRVAVTGTLEQTPAGPVCHAAAVRLLGISLLPEPAAPRKP